MKKILVLVIALLSTSIQSVPVKLPDETTLKNRLLEKNLHNFISKTDFISQLADKTVEPPVVMLVSERSQSNL